MKLPHVLTLCLLLSPCAFGAVVVWDAGADLRSNEIPDTPQELINPNFAVPQWSYGYRANVASTALTLFAGLSDHTNNYGNSSLVQGWTLGGGVPGMGVNISESPVIYNFGFGPLVPLNPGEISMHPQVGQHAVVRWTAPADGDYTINSHWEDQDPHGGSGAAGYVVINGVIVAGGPWANGVGNGFTDTDRTVPLVAGDVVDFVLDANGDFTFDTTKFNATVTPEPSAGAMLLLAMAGTLGVRRRRS
jgi:hypothetical protein